MRTVTIPPDVPALDFATNEPALTPDGKPIMVRWCDVIKALFNDPRVLERMNVFAANDLRTKLLEATGTVEIGDDEHGVLKELAASPRTIQQSAVWSAMPFLRAINDATTKA